MPTDKNALKAGLFIFAAIAIGATLLVLLQGSKDWFEPTRKVTAEFDLAENLGGLKPGDPVRIGGFDQGRVASVRYIARDGGSHMEVDFTLPKKYELRSDAVVGVEQALTGQANLNVSDFGHAGPLADGHNLDGRPSAIGTLYAIAPELQALVADLHAKVNPAYARYDKTLSNADAAVQEGKRAMAAFTDFLGGSGTDLRGTLANLNHVTAKFDERMPKTFDKADAFIDETKQTIADARDAVHDARAAINVARDTLADARGMLIRNHSRVDNILASARETANNLEGASAEIRRSPWRLLYKPSADEVNNLTLYDSTRQFARAAGQLDDAAGAVRDAAADPGVDRKQLESLMSDLQQTFAKYHEVEQVLWKNVK